MAWHPTLDVLASSSYDDTVKIYKEDPADNDWTCIATLQSHESTVWSLAFDKTGERLATCSDDKTVKIWKEYKHDNKQGVVVNEKDAIWKCVCTLSGYHTRCVYDIDWCHKTGLLATACGDDIIRVFKETEVSDADAPSFELVCTKQNAHSQDVNCVMWNTTGNGELLSCSDDGVIRIWNYSE